jgi:hypothetical protein
MATLSEKIKEIQTLSKMGIFAMPGYYPIPADISTIISNLSCSDEEKELLRFQWGIGMYTDMPQHLSYMLQAFTKNYVPPKKRRKNRHLMLSDFKGMRIAEGNIKYATEDYNTPGTFYVITDLGVVRTFTREDAPIFLW